MPRVFCVDQAANMFVVHYSIWSFSWQMQFVWLDLISCCNIFPCRRAACKPAVQKELECFFPSERGETLLQVSCTTGPCCLWWNALWVLMQFRFRLVWRLANLLGFKKTGSERQKKQSLDLNRTITMLETLKGTSWCSIVISFGTPENDAV